MSSPAVRRGILDLRLNPVLAKEIRERVRSPRATAMIVVFLALMSLLLYSSFALGMRSYQGSSYGFFTGPRLGRAMFETLMIVLLCIVGFIAPAIAASSIVGEKERRTLHLLQVTLLKPRSIVLGKLGSSLAFIALMVVVTAPLFSVPLVLGGVTVGQVLRGFFVLMCIALVLSSMGIYMSSIARRQQVAIVATFLLVLIYSLGSTAAFAGETYYWNLRFGSGPRPVSIAMYFNPMMAMASAVATDSSAVLSPLSQILRSMLDVGQISSFYSSIGTPPLLSRTLGRVWLIHALVALAFSALLLFLASQRLRAPSPRFTIGKKT